MVTGLEQLILNLTSEFPELANPIRYRKPSGGYFVWLQLPSWFDSKKAVIVAEKEFRFTFQPGTVASKHPETGLRCLRLCFAKYNEETILDGLSRLEKLFKLIYTNHLAGKKI